MATLEQAVATLEKLVVELGVRERPVRDLSDAYEGQFDLHFASEDFQKFFADRYDQFADNWCGIVADAPHERLEVTGFRLPGAQNADDDLWRTWLETDSDAHSDLAFLDAIIAKRAYALVWAADGAGEEPQITWEHPSQAIVAYDPETRARRAGAKVWRDDDTSKDYATLYLPDEIWKFERGASTSGLILPNNFVGGWKLRENLDPNPIPNPMGKVPLVEVPNRPRLLGEPVSDISGAMAMQHAINLFWAQMFAASDEATIGQRIVIGAEMPKVPVLDADGQKIGEKPIDLKKFARGSALWLEDPTAKIEQWQAAKLDVFTNVIEIMVGHLAAQTRTPAHYLLIGGTIANVSGDALVALEAGLVKRTEEKTQHFGRAIRDVFELVALVKGETAKAAEIRRGKTLWKDVENRSDAQRSDALLKKKSIGYPLRYLLERDELSPTEIDRVMDMVRDENADPILGRLLGGLVQQQMPNGTEGVTGGDGPAASVL